MLAGEGLVIFDEFYQRNLYSDLGLALTLDVHQVLRDELKLATLDCEAILLKRIP